MTTFRPPEFRLLFNSPVPQGAESWPNNSTCLMISTLNSLPLPSQIYFCAISSISETLVILLHFASLTQDSLGFPLSTNCLLSHIKYWIAPQGTPSSQELSAGIPSSFFFRITLWYKEFPRLGLNRCMAAGLHHSHSNTGSKPHLWHTPQLTATPDR